MRLFQIFFNSGDCILTLSYFFGIYFTLLNFSRMNQPVGLYLLTLLLGILALGALYGGLQLMLDPSGKSLKMPLERVGNGPFPNYRIPGLVLFLLLGVAPGLVCVALWLKPDWPQADIFNIYTDRHWAWTYSLYTGIALILWIDFQIYWVGYKMLLQTVFAFIGVAIVMLTLLPSVQRYYQL